MYYICTTCGGQRQRDPAKPVLNARTHRRGETLPRRRLRSRSLDVL